MLRRLSAAFVCIFLFAGCSQTSFVGRQVQNFTAYYNTFYNARQSFDEGIRNIERTPTTIDESRFLPVYPPAPENVARAQFDDAIKRSADVIRNHPSSRWVDDAVLLIGKSYFYQRNYPAAIQKFREAIDLGTDLESEARFWLARTLVANGARSEARDHITYSLDAESLHNRWRGPLLLTYADLLVVEENWEAAAPVLTEGLDEIRDREVEPRAFFLLGQVNEMRGAPDEAAQAYRAVARYQPHYELEFKARLHELRTAALAGDVDGALVELRRMERDDKHRDRRSEIAYTRGVVEAEAERYDRAFDAFDILLYDTDYDITPVRGRAHYALATLYRDVYEDFVLAAAHFDSSATTLQAGAGTISRENLTRVAITDSREQSGIYRSYAQAYSQVTEMDSLLYLGAMPDDEFDEFVREQRQKLAEELEARRREEERLRAQARFADGIASQQGSLPEAQTPTDAAEVGAAGFLFHRDPTRIQEGRQAFIRRWGNRPPVPGWRRQEAVDTYIVSQQEGSPDEQNALIAIDDFDLGLPIFDVSAVPRTPDAYQRMVAGRALSRYELGNVLFLSMNRPQDAARLYRQVIEENADLPVAARAYYALAEVHRSIDDDDEARRLYQVVLDRYPNSDLDRRIREELGLPQLAATDSAAVTREAMNDAAQARLDGRLDDAFAGYLDVALTYPDYHTAAPALYSAAQTGLAWIRRDGHDLDAPLPAGRADSLVTAAGLQWVPPEPQSPDPQPADTLDIDITQLSGADPSDNDSGDVDAGASSDEQAVPDVADAPENAIRDNATGEEVSTPEDVVVDDEDFEGEASDIEGLDDEGLDDEPAPDGEPASDEELPDGISDSISDSVSDGVLDDLVDAVADTSGAIPGGDQTITESAGGDNGDLALVAPEIADADTAAVSVQNVPQPIISVGLTLDTYNFHDVAVADTVVGVTIDAILDHIIERYPSSRVTAGAALLLSGIQERLVAVELPLEGDPTEIDPSEAVPTDIDPAEISSTEADPLEVDPLDNSPRDIDQSNIETSPTDSLNYDPPDNSPPEIDQSTIETSPPDSLNLDTQEMLRAAGDSLSVDIGEVAPPDSVAVPNRSFGMMGEEEVDPSAGGWTIVAGSFDGAEGAEELAADLRDRNFRVSLVESTDQNGAPLYVVYAGQVEQRAQAATSLRANPDAFPHEARIVKLDAAVSSAEER